MKTRILIFFISASLCIGVCCFSSIFVISSMKHLGSIRDEAEQFLSDGNQKEALRKTEEMIEFIEKRSTLFEMLTPHEDLHDLVLTASDARISLDINDMDDYIKAIRLIEENIRHLIAHESISLGNLF